MSEILPSEVQAAYRRGYSRGYSAGKGNKWPEYAPPSPPDEIVLKLFVAAKDLQDAAISVLSVIIPDEPIFLELQRQSEIVDEAWHDISKWLTDRAAAETA